MFPESKGEDCWQLLPTKGEKVDAKMKETASTRDKAPLAVFIDFEGTLNDVNGSGRLYVRDFLSWARGSYPADPAVWATALAKAMEGVFRNQAAAARHPAAWPGYVAYRRRELTVWAQDLFREAGMVVPGDEEALDLALRLEDEVPSKMVPLPGALELVNALADHNGRQLFIASGAPSTYTKQCLQSAGVLGYFQRVLGPDVVDTLKTGPEYYRRAFRATGYSPDQCAVIDDSPGPLAWALQTGARAVVAVGKASETAEAAGAAGGPEPATPLPPGKLFRAASLSGVPAILEQLEA